MEFTPEQSSFLLKLATYSWPLVIPFFLFHRRKHEKLEERFNNSEHDCGKCKEQISRLEEKTKHLLTIQQLNKELDGIYHLLRTTGENQAFMRAKLEAQGNLLQNIDRFLREKK